MKKALKVLYSINLKVCYISMISLFVLMLLTTINVTIRKLSLGGIPDSLDFTELLLVLIIYCSMAFLESEKGHIRVDMFLIMFPDKIKRYVEAFWYLLSSGTLFLFFYAMFSDIGSTYKSGAATQVLHVPEWPFTVVVTVAIFLYAVTVTLHLIELLTGDEAKQAA